jgi:hypothetical protein
MLIQSELFEIFILANFDNVNFIISLQMIILCRSSHLLFKTNNFGRFFSQTASMSSLVKDKAYVDGQWISAKNGATYEGNLSNKKNTDPQYLINMI